jgi:MerR family copper efflux transcriptional regulator
MNIGEASHSSGVSAKMIRYYESIGLIPPPARSDGGYRVYTDTDVRRLNFIHRAREFGFPVERIRVLIGLWQGGRPSREVKEIALAHVAELQDRIARLTAMAETVQELADACHGDHRPDCPILHDLEKNEGAQATTGNVTPIMSPSRTKVASRAADQPSVPAGRMGRTIQR